MPLVANDITVIIPIAPNETKWSELYADLKNLSDKLEIILVGPVCPKSMESIWIKSPLGRAQQMNFAAKYAKTKYVWFLHADSRLTKDSLKKLIQSIREKPNSLHYFDLVFLNDGPKLMTLNTIGTYFRSNYLGMPYGDQGFALRRDDFLRLGGFPDAKYGEDHLFVWHWRKNGRDLKRVDDVIYTSARKYVENGWLKTTLKHIWLGGKQGWSEYFKKPGAIAVFVKTPRYSSVKTRMAKNTSTIFAVKFHLLSANVTAAEVLRFCNESRYAKGYWAIAEESGLNDWRGLKPIYQGEGDLGDRLYNVYSSLLKNHSWVILLGADCPELDTKTLQLACDKLNSSDFVVGPASDGGFYLFAGKKRLPKSFWTKINYSLSTTFSELINNLKNHGKIEVIKELHDIDTREDSLELLQRLQKMQKHSVEIQRLKTHLIDIC